MRKFVARAPGEYCEAVPIPGRSCSTPRGSLTSSRPDSGSSVIGVAVGWGVGVGTSVGCGTGVGAPGGSVGVAVDCNAVAVGAIDGDVAVGGTGVSITGVGGTGTCAVANCSSSVSVGVGVTPGVVFAPDEHATETPTNADDNTPIANRQFREVSGLADLKFTYSPNVPLISR